MPETPFPPLPLPHISPHQRHTHMGLGLLRRADSGGWRLEALALEVSSSQALKDQGSRTEGPRSLTRMPSVLVDLGPAAKGY